MTGSGFKLIAGLGNPGMDYARTRHNIGFSVVDAIASSLNLSIDRSRFSSKYVKTKIKKNDVFLLKPMTYMNRSGNAISQFVSYYKIAVPDIIVVHDDMDLETGRIKIARNRGHGGHNGVRSIIDLLGSRDFVRIRIGVGHPGNAGNVTKHVLGNFSSKEAAIMDECIEMAADACIMIIEKGPSSAMNFYNAG
jgi:PTH1 family peptidyl-tRNA hydrolase